MDVIFAEGVFEEVAESAEYYENEVEGLGKSFLEKVGAGLEDIKKTPLLFRIIQKDYRRHLIDRFPFGIIYRLHENKIYILAIMHLKRKPDCWLKRENT